MSSSGISLVSSSGGPVELADAARLAERAGFASVWATEFYDRSATVALAAMAQATSTIDLGSAIAYAFGRTPLVLAAEARDLDELSDGRITLGLGTGTKRMQQDWHGLNGEHPASRMEELIPLLRRLWRLHEGSIDHDGPFYRLYVQPTAPPRPPLRLDIPIYMAGVNSRMIEAAGAVADGLVGHPLFTPRYVREVARPALMRGAERAGRAKPPPIAGYLTCSVGADRGSARAAAAAIIAFNSTVKTYRATHAAAAAIIAFNSTVKTYRATHEVGGFEREAEAIRAAWSKGDFAAMTAAVSEEMIDAIALAGTPDEVRSRFAERWDGVYERTLLWPPAFLGQEGVRAVTDTFHAPE
jgi:probable F420-dependent oxidoreductase